jgi:hypothetical protein
MHVDNNCTIADSTAFNNLDTGIRALADTAIRQCTAASNTVDGILVTNACRVIDNTCDANATGIRVEMSGTTDPYSNRIDGNSCNKNQVGFAINGLFNQTIRNNANNNSSQGYSIQGSALNQTGPIITANGTITSQSPWANFEK